jgi:uncharacterized membrane protein
MLCDLVTNAQPYTVLILIYITLFELRKKINERRINREHLKSSLYTNCQIVRAERNSILQALLICIYIAFYTHVAVQLASCDACY